MQSWHAVNKKSASTLMCKLYEAQLFRSTCNLSLDCVLPIPKVLSIHWSLGREGQIPDHQQLMRISASCLNNELLGTTLIRNLPSYHSRTACLRSFFKPRRGPSGALKIKILALFSGFPLMLGNCYHTRTCAGYVVHNTRHHSFSHKYSFSYLAHF